MESHHDGSGSQPFYVRHTVGTVHLSWLLKYLLKQMYMSDIKAADSTAWVLSSAYILRITMDANHSPRTCSIV